jgi:hypothetical protein
VRRLGIGSLFTFIFVMACISGWISEVKYNNGFLRGFFSMLIIPAALALPWFRGVRRHVAFHLLGGRERAAIPHPDTWADLPPRFLLIATVVAYGVTALQYGNPLDGLFQFLFGVPCIAVIGGLVRSYWENGSEQRQAVLRTLAKVVAAVAILAIAGVWIWMGWLLIVKATPSYSANGLGWEAIKSSLLLLVRLTIGAPLFIGFTMAPLVCPLILGWALGAPLPDEVSPRHATMATAADLAEAGLSRDL